MYSTALLSPSSRHHSEHEHFFNHSRKGIAVPSGGRVSHPSICSHHSSQLSTCHHLPSFPSPFFLAYLILLSFCFLSSPLFSFPSFFTLSCLHSFSVSLCYLFLFLHPPPVFYSGWKETFCLRQGSLFLPY